LWSVIFFFLFSGGVGPPPPTFLGGKKGGRPQTDPQPPLLSKPVGGKQWDPLSEGGRGGLAGKTWGFKHLGNGTNNTGETPNLKTKNRGAKMGFFCSVYGYCRVDKSFFFVLGANKNAFTFIRLNTAGGGWGLFLSAVFEPQKRGSGGRGGGAFSLASGGGTVRTQNRPKRPTPTCVFFRHGTTIFRSKIQGWGAGWVKTLKVTPYCLGF